MPSQSETERTKFPVLKTILNRPKKPGWVSDSPFEDIYYSIAFYPYLDAFEDPVFAVVGGMEVYVMRPSEKEGVEVLMHFVDDNKNEVLCSSAWSKDKRTGKPLLAVAGDSGTIKILDILGGKVQRTLLGHGEGVLDLQVSPQNPYILASASEDTSVRIWSLDPAHEKQPCAAIFSGEGHRETVLSIAFHECGKYLLSSGMDHTVNLWVIPDLPDATTGTDKPHMIRYPHFSTSRIHTNYIDKVAFFGDLIISKAAKEHKIVMWKIHNFSSKSSPPPPEQAPTTFEFRDTRSCFGGTFDRLLQFQVHDTEPFYMLFGLYAKPSAPPVLAMGSTTGKIHLWELNRVLEKGPPGDPFIQIKAHHIYDMPKIRTCIRNVGWSVGGEYMVAVGDEALIAVFKRP